MIVVTTPTGHIGSKLSDLLTERGEPFRVIARDPARLAPSVREAAEVITGSHADPAVLDAALPGADALFLVVPPDRGADSVTGHYVEYARQARAAIERHRVGHLVHITTMGAGAEDAGQLSAALEMDAVLGGAGVARRGIAAPFFMENLLAQLDGLGQGVLALPNSGDVPLPVVATDDLAALAAGLLTDRSWDGVERLPISSSDAVTPVGVAAVIGEALGREVSFRQIDPGDYGAMLRGFGLSEAWAEGLVAMSIAQNDGFYAADLEPARGLAPTTLIDWCRRVLRPALRL